MGSGLSLLVERRVLAVQLPLPRLRVGVVLVAWDLERSLASLQELRAHLPRVEARHRVDVAVVANAPELLSALQPALPPRAVLRTGSNAGGEFTGYQEGVELLDPDGDIDVWVLLNDRCASYDDEHRLLFDATLLGLVAREDVLVGHVDALPRPFDVLATGVSAYCRTNYLALSARLLTRTGGVQTWSPAALDQVLPRTHVPSLALLRVPGAPSDYLAFLDGWLRQGVGSGPRWYRAKPPLPEHWPEVRAKLGAVLNEHGLTARVLGAGAVCLDVRQAALLARCTPRRRRRELVATLARPLRAQVFPGSRTLRGVLALRGAAALLCARTRPRAPRPRSATPAGAA